MAEDAEVPPARSFLDTGLDFSRDELSPEETVGLVSWYRENHGGDELSKFTTYLIEHDPAGFKRYRRHILEIDETRDGAALPEVAHLLAFTYTYACLANEKGTLYAVINARRLGASRREILDCLRLATPVAGPFGLNAVGERTDAYLRDWEEPDRPTAIAWPEGWVPDRAAFRSGMDLSSAEIREGDLEALRAWHRRVYGEVPDYLEPFARWHPRALKTQRMRFEGSLGDALPPQMAALCMLQLAAVRLTVRPLRRAGQLALALGAQRPHIVAMLFWAGIYGGDTVMETAFGALGDLLEAAGG